MKHLSMALSSETKKKQQQINKKACAHAYAHKNKHVQSVYRGGVTKDEFPASGSGRISEGGV